MSEEKLIQEIIQRSHSNIWDIAKTEWALHKIYEAEEPKKCLCGHFPIIEVCILRNTINDQLAMVGNCCVKRFIGLPSGLIFAAVKRVKKDHTKSLNAAALQYAQNRGWIDPWEYGFLINTMRKLILSEKQLKTRIKINKKMLFNMKISNLQC